MAQGQGCSGCSLFFGGMLLVLRHCVVDDSGREEGEALACFRVKSGLSKESMPWRRHWEDWCMFQALQAPPRCRKRAVFDVTLGPGPGHAGTGQTVRMSLALTGVWMCVTGVRLEQEMEMDPTATTSSSTVPVNVAGTPTEGPTEVAFGGVPTTLDHEEYERQYWKYRKCIIGELYVLAVWGESTLDLMQAQQVVEESEGAEKLPLLRGHGAGA